MYPGTAEQKQNFLTFSVNWFPQSTYFMPVCFRDNAAYSDVDLIQIREPVFLFSKKTRTIDRRGYFQNINY